MAAAAGDDDDDDGDDDDAASQTLSKCSAPLRRPVPPRGAIPLPLNPLASQAAVAAAAAAAMGSIAGSQVFGNALSNLQGATGQLVTNAQGQYAINPPFTPSIPSL
ncbi:unnamed protein product [Pleuronectes platessa]|uniref:Uncharacterized protein n=1 Tax=Pleuronectes platessa TaxID=8262 RepID=A0A9N7YY05_PLEPL|nr:unnamed protein product [Pleuronectes platessa]